MKIYSLITVILLSFNVSLYSQNITCDCKSDLDFLVEKQRKMPSFKKQIKGKKEKIYKRSYELLSSKMTSDIPIEECYKLLLQQKTLINDVHSSLRVNSELFKNLNIESDIEINKFKNSEFYKQLPKLSGDINKKVSEISNMDSESYEGIYTTKDGEKIGISYSKDKTKLVGFIIDSPLKHWEKGQIRFYLKPNKLGKYNMYTYDKNDLSPKYIESLSFDNGRIWSYKKQGNTNNYEFNPHKDSLTKFEQINNDTQYIFIKSFSNSKKLELRAFIEEVKTKLTAPNVIIDLRSNTGGNKKYSDPFHKILKDKNVYVLTNSFTGSNAEQFTKRLKEKNNALHLGQATFGVIAYGINYGTTYTSPSKSFIFKPTDMNFHKEFYKYEGKGITPDVILDFGSDWVEQTLDIINNKNI